jgi:hypothetical protein
MTSDREQPERSDLVATLIRSAGRRVEPPPEAFSVIFAAAEATWRRKVTRRRVWRYGIGLAATFVMAVVGTAYLRSVLPTLPPPQVARVDGIGGEVQTRPKGAGAWVPLAAGRLPLYAGTRLRTGLDGRADLSLEGGVSLRVATQTEIEFAYAGRRESAARALVRRHQVVPAAEKASTSSRLRDRTRPWHAVRSAIRPRGVATERARGQRVVAARSGRQSRRERR